MSNENVQIGIEIGVGSAKLSTSMQATLSDLGAKVRALTEALAAEAETIRKLGTLSPSQAAKPKPLDQSPVPAIHGPADDVWGRIATGLGIERGKLIGNRVFGFKGTSPQILNPTAFKTPNAAFRALAYLNEVGNAVKETPFATLTALADTSRIKAAYAAIVGDLKKTGMIEPKRYDDSKMITLTAKGEQTAKNELKFLLEESAGK